MNGDEMVRDFMNGVCGQKNTNGILASRQDARMDSKRLSEN